MEKQILLNGISMNDLVDVMLEKLSSLGILNNMADDNDDLLTTKEAREYLRMSRTTFWEKRKKGIIPSYGMGNKVYFIKKELKNCMQKIN